MFGDKRRRTKGKKPCAVKGGPKPAEVASFNPPPAQPCASRKVQSRWLNHRRRSRLATGSQLQQPRQPEREQQRFPPQPIPPSTGRSSLPPTARVELPPRAAAPVEQVALKRKATSPLPPEQETRHTSPTSPTRWERAQSRLKGRFRRCITPPLDNIADLPRELPSQRWHQLPEDMGEINIGLVDERLPSAALILTHFQWSTVPVGLRRR